MYHPNVDAVYDFLNSLDYDSGWGAYGTEYRLYIGKASQEKKFLDLIRLADPSLTRPSEDNRVALRRGEKMSGFHHNFRTLVEDGFTESGGETHKEGACYRIYEYEAIWHLWVDVQFNGAPAVEWRKNRDVAPMYVIFVKD